jgi:hypothetical protein
MLLYGDLFAQGEYQGSVCKLKALYDLKQSMREWFGKFSEAIIEFALHRYQTDHSVFYILMQDIFFL